MLELVKPCHGGSWSELEMASTQTTFQNMPYALAIVKTTP